MSKIILVADDNEIVRREICRLLLRETECEVCGEAEHGLDAIEKSQQLHPNLIILDLSMPVMNGIDAARVLRLRMPTVPIIMFTSYTYILEGRNALCGRDRSGFKIRCFSPDPKSADPSSSRRCLTTVCALERLFRPPRSNIF